MRNGLRCAWLAFIAMLGLVISGAGAAFAEPGRIVRNTVTLTYDDGVGGIRTVQPPPALFTVETARTPSTITFFRYAPAAPDAQAIALHGSDYSPDGGLVGPWDSLASPRLLNGEAIDIASGPVPLIPADRFLSGETMFIQVTDVGQNADPGRIETVVITLTSISGDRVVLRLYETGPDTGVFFGWIVSSDEPTPVNDNRITAPDKSQLTAVYADPFDTNEVSVDTALVDPFGRLFDSLTGALLDGITVTVVDAATGQPAPVFGIDGRSRYPSTVVTGSQVTDASGFVYQLEPGQFLFPLMAPGRYRLLLEGIPEAYAFPSLATAFDGLANGPFVIIDGSYGREFVVDGSGPLTFDVPLDPNAELLVSKQAMTAQAAPGDIVAFAVSVTNRDVVPGLVQVRDVLPQGFRFRSGSVRVNGERVADPRIAPDGVSLTFSLGVLAPGETIRVEYATAVGAGVRMGDAVNRAVAIDAQGRENSNRAEAVVRVQEDLIRSRLTIVGRVAEAGCEADDAWARELKDGVGVAGVRIYLEDGSYTLSDANGLFHFEGVRPGTHVVQVDTETLPQGYTVMECEENTRYAGSLTSKFVDSPGGVIWRANFYLQRTGEVAQEAEPEAFNDAVEHQGFDADWLATQDASTDWVYPDPSRTPSTPSLNIGIKHAPDLSAQLWLNGAEVSGLNYAGRDSDGERIALSRWRGVDIADGANRMEVRLSNADGEVVETLVREIWYVTKASRAVRVADQSSLVADGRTVPTLALRIEDDAGRAVHAGRVLKVDVSAPYRLLQAEALENEASVTRSLAGNGGVAVGADGIARIQLQPTLETGRISVRVTLDDSREEVITAYLAPETRDWIVVGLAEGVIGSDGVSGPGSVVLGDDGEDLFTDGRVAFYAKGLVKGDWLLTLAVDTDKRRGARDGDFASEIDPNAYYTLYGDRSYQGQDAVSRYPVFVKLEKEQAQFLFGDYATGLDETVLGRYQRRLTGVRVIYEGDRFSFTGFAAETNQGFARDEIAADGTSGPYRLSRAPLIRQSEVITVETRERFRPDQVIETRSLIRYLDYDVDYDTGELVFLAPVDAVDASLNPRVIVVTYETPADAERNVTAGGRAAVRVAGDRIEAGVTLVHEEGSTLAAGADADLAAVDLTLRLAERSEVRAEYAQTRRTEAGEDVRGEAFLIEGVHQSETLSATAYLREDREGFGLGQQSGATADTRRYGVTASAQLGEHDNARSGLRSVDSLQVDAYREENLTSGDTRSVAQLSVRRDNPVLSLDGGVRLVEENLEGGGQRVSVLALAGVRRTFADQGLSLIARHEQPLGSRNESSLFPQRTVIGFDKTLTDWATLNVRHEIVDGDNASGQNTVAGIRLQPWTGAEVRVAADSLSNEAGTRLGATLGVDQSVQFSENWSASFGAANRSKLSGTDDVLDVVRATPVGPLSTASLSELSGGEDYSAAYAGLGYRDVIRVASGRVEVRDSALGRRYAGVLSGAQDFNEEVTFAASLRHLYEDNRADADTRATEARFGFSLRPRGEGLIVYNRLDLRFEDTVGVSTSWKAVNNMALNTMLSDATQVSAYWGLKYARTRINGDTAAGWTNLIGGQLRHDLSPDWDVGFTASALHTALTGTTDYAFGPTVGFKPHDNVWLSVGYNLEGFIDEDFQAAEYSREGFYLKVRAKFDQDSLSGLLDLISPEGR